MKKKIWLLILAVLLLAALAAWILMPGAQDRPDGTTPPDSGETTQTTTLTAASATTDSRPTQGTTAAVTQTTAATTVPSVSAPPETQPTVPQTDPAPTTEPAVPPTTVPATHPATEPTAPSTAAPDTAPACDHSFGQWQYEEYTYRQQGIYPDTQWYDRVSHRQVRTCTKCGYKETGGTPDHPCTKGCANHTITTVKEGTCSTKAIMRSTCKICGWYVEYEGKKGSHTIKTETRHLTDYGTYTNELDAIISECTSCGTKAVNYQQGEGWSDYNRYRMKWSTVTGAAYAGQPTTDNFAYVDHPEWQMVFRDFKYDSEGYVEEFTIYWWYNGSRYSQVIDCGEGVWESWFAEYNMADDGAYNYTYQIRCFGTYWEPWKRTWTS